MWCELLRITFKGRNIGIGSLIGSSWGLYLVVSVALAHFAILEISNMAVYVAEWGLGARVFRILVPFK